jgi:GT2 family glycosyltransferase
MTRADLSIIIVSWNVKELLVACLHSIYQAADSIALEIIVVDNASIDGSADVVTQQFPNVQVIRNQENIGFPAANNQGLQICSGKFILLLNPDTIVVGDALRAMLQYVETHPEVGLLGPRLVSADGNIQYVCARSFPTPLSWFWHYSLLSRIFPRSRRLGELLLSYWDHTNNCPVDAIVGAAMLMPRRTLETVGFLDESHPMYLEDLDYCVRVHQQGQQVYYLSDAVIVHYGGQSSVQVSWETRLLSLEAHRLLFRRYPSLGTERNFRLATIIAGLIRAPLLVGAQIFRSLTKRSLPGEGMTNPRLELSMVGWGLGVMQPPQIRDVRPN